MTPETNIIHCQNCRKKYEVNNKQYLKELQLKPFFCKGNCERLFHFNEKWKAKEHWNKPKPLTGKSSECIDRDFFRKKYGIKSKYKVVRG